jgi:hypothetical protein
MGLSAAQLERLKKAVRAATRVPSDAVAERLELDDTLARDVAVLCRGGGREGCFAGHELVAALLRGAGSSAVRLQALRLFDMLFRRSRAFREAAYPALRELVPCVVEVPGLLALPPPDAFRRLLHRTALGLLGEWATRFGGENAMLLVTRRFLQAKLAGGAALEAAAELPGGAQRAARERAAREERSRRLLRAQFETVRGEMSEALGGGLELAAAAAAQMHDCAQLLEELLVSSEALAAAPVAVPPPAAASSDDSDSDEDPMDGIDWSNVATLSKQLEPGQHSFGSGQVDDDVAEWEALEAAQRRADERIEEARRGTAHLPSGFRLVVTVPSSGEPPAAAAPAPVAAASSARRKFHVSELAREPSSEPVVASLRAAAADAVQVHLPALQRWVRVLTQVEPDNPGTERERGALLQRALALRARVQAAVHLAKELGIVGLDGSAAQPGDLLEVLAASEEPGTVLEPALPGAALAAAPSPKVRPSVKSASKASGASSSSSSTSSGSSSACANASSSAIASSRTGSVSAAGASRAAGKRPAALDPFASEPRKARPPVPQAPVDPFAVVPRPKPAQGGAQPPAPLDPFAVLPRPKSAQGDAQRGRHS